MCCGEIVSLALHPCVFDVLEDVKRYFTISFSMHLLKSLARGLLPEGASQKTLDCPFVIQSPLTKTTRHSVGPPILCVPCVSIHPIQFGATVTLLKYMSSSRGSLTAVCLVIV